MLGFDAVGRLALGQLSTIGLTNTVLPAGTGAFAETSFAATFRILQASGGASCSVAANAATFGAKLAVAAGSYSFAGAASMFSTRLATGAGNFVFTGSASTFATRLSAGTGLYTVAARRRRSPFRSMPVPAFISSSVIPRPLRAISRPGSRDRSEPTNGLAQRRRPRPGRR
jgi:hypothetical protein